MPFNVRTKRGAGLQVPEFSVPRAFGNVEKRPSKAHFTTLAK